MNNAEPGGAAVPIQGRVLLRRRSGVLRLATLIETRPARLSLLLYLEGEGEPRRMLDGVQRVLLRHFPAYPAEISSYQVAGPILLARCVVSLAAAPDEAQLDRLEHALQRFSVPWSELVRSGLARRCGKVAAETIWSTLAEGISSDYRSHVHPRFVPRDLQALAAAGESGRESFALWGPFPGRDGHWYRLQHYAVTPVPLNTLLPLFANIGLSVDEEQTFTFPLAARPVYLKSFVVRGPKQALPLATVRMPLLQLLEALSRGEVENDYLNRLLLGTGLDWQQIDIFRGYRNYLFQLHSPFSKRRVAQALIDYPAVALLLYRYFEARFQPEGKGTEERELQRLYPLRQELAAALDGVADANADRILRTLFNLIDSTVRTSYFLRRGRPGYFFAFKISALGIIDMPAPRPLYEIYVHAAQMQGVHLRGGMIARGGIRWSDRPDDFRTEVLGLMKTQMTKNVVIVPVGSKGGFVVREPARDRAEAERQAQEAYRTLIRGLLDLTDNRRGAVVQPPPGVVAYDGADPYLVVAADKGTAHFSDLANAISAEYGFWLGDAFASGGSHGYDHKQLAITARGAWECVRMHFRELGRNIEQEPLSVVGIGDMSGDVFGNGLLRSRTIRLRAAFDHRHIFLDPEPDPERSFGERARLFALPRSSWDDYDRDALSPGGGVFRRDAKEIPLSAEVRQWLHLHQESIDPPGLIRRLLCAEVDLLWNGGIGTYVKASDESPEEVGDHANDAVRVDGADLHALVVGEGGNLGFTQRGRIEYALHGGRINTDAVDNSGGVDCSDHEVNLKIFMRLLLDEGLVGSAAERDALLQQVSDEVCRAVLADNVSQSRCLSLDELRCREDVEPFLAMIPRLVDAGLLDRKVEHLPESEAVLRRSGRALVRPELAILMAYAKMQLAQALQESPLPGSDGARLLLQGYFPEQLRVRFAAAIPRHPLARELAATVMANHIVNHAGSAFLLRLQRQTGADTVRLAEVYLALDLALDGPLLRERLAADGAVPAVDEYRALLQWEAALEALCRSALKYGDAPYLTEQSLRIWRERARTFQTAREEISVAEADMALAAVADGWQRCGIGAREARQLALLPGLVDLPLVAELAEAAACTLQRGLQVLQGVRSAFALDLLLTRVQALPLRDDWERQAQRALHDDLDTCAARIAAAVLADGAGTVGEFLQDHPRAAAAVRALREQLQRDLPPAMAPLLVLLQPLRELFPGGDSGRCRGGD